MRLSLVRISVLPGVLGGQASMQDPELQPSQSPAVPPMGGSPHYCSFRACGNLYGGSRFLRQARQSERDRRVWWMKNSHVPSKS